VRQRLFLVRLRTMVKNRLHALLERYHVPVPELSDLFGKKGHKYLARVVLPHSAQPLLSQDLRMLELFDGEIKQTEQWLQEAVRGARRLLKSKNLAGQKVLVFTEFADTARYLKRRLDEAGIEGVEQVDSATKRNRADVIQRFSSYYNGLSSPELEKQGRGEIRIFISTDVLSEGLNLQDASRVINYDIHWNPVHLMQGKKLLTPEDDYEALKEFNRAYEGTRTAVEGLHLEYQALLQAHPELEDRLARFPAAIFSGRKRPAKGVRGRAKVEGQWKRYCLVHNIEKLAPLGYAS
jgi:hypothetical protein